MGACPTVNVTRSRALNLYLKSKFAQRLDDNSHLTQVDDNVLEDFMDEYLAPQLLNARIVPDDYMKNGNFTKIKAQISYPQAIGHIISHIALDDNVLVISFENGTYVVFEADEWSGAAWIKELPNAIGSGNINGVLEAAGVGTKNDIELHHQIAKANEVKENEERCRARRKERFLELKAEFEGTGNEQINS